MSIYAQFSDGDSPQIASNTGWGDLLRWVSLLDNPPETLVGLFDDGWHEPISAIADAIQSLVDTPPEDPTIQTTLQGFLQILLDHADRTDAIVISDGTAPDDEPQETTEAEQATSE